MLLDWRLLLHWSNTTGHWLISNCMAASFKTVKSVSFCRHYQVCKSAACSSENLTTIHTAIGDWLFIFISWMILNLRTLSLWILNGQYVYMYNKRQIIHIYLHVFFASIFLMNWKISILYILDWNMLIKNYPV